jgi:imidazolonepropionase-like amidohydrolase
MLHTDVSIRVTPFAEFAPALETAAVVRALTPLDVMHIVTRIPAEGLGLSDEAGTIEPGTWADLVAVEVDPLRDITAV